MKKKRDDASPRQRPPSGSSSSSYETLKERARARNLALSRSGRDIGELPSVVNPSRKARAERDFRAFCDSYFPATFHLRWSGDHLRVISKIEQAVLRGGLFAVAMPRGSGKSSLCEAAAIWAALYGHREFGLIIGPDEEHAAQMLDAIRGELACNELLLEDFPEAVYPIHRLDGIHQRAAGQLYRGQRTHIGLTAREIILPTIPGSRASGAIIRVAGITGRIRGARAKRADGRTVRPSLVIVDDPQTDESARSPSQCATRERIIAGAVLGLAGPGVRISGIMPCTVIRPGDLADRLLDRDRHPEWNGERTKLVYAFPTNEALWNEYANIRAESLRQGRGGEEATEFYRANRAAMDEGAVVAWPERYNPDEISAIQHAMNLRLLDEAAFWAEYQNEPMPETTTRDNEDMTAAQVAAKINRMKRGEVPIGCTHLTAFVDVQQALLYYCVVAWEDDYTGYIIDYGTYPDQHRPYFTLRDARSTLLDSLPNGGGVEAAIYAGLETLAGRILGRAWRRDDGAEIHVDRCLVDANWGQSTDIVYQYCRQSVHASVIMPSHGRYVGASSRPMSEWQRKPGDRVGHHWRIPTVQGRRAIRHVLYDTNHWKSFVFARLAVPMGSRGCLSLFGDKPETHRLFAEHLTAEYRVRTEGRGRTVDEWHLRPERGDNHWLDCLVGCAVAASIQGVVLPGTGSSQAPPPKRERVSFAELQQRRAGRR